MVRGGLKLLKSMHIDALRLKLLQGMHIDFRLEANCLKVLDVSVLRGEARRGGRRLPPHDVALLVIC